MAGRRRRRRRGNGPQPQEGQGQGGPPGQGGYASVWGATGESSAGGDDASYEDVWAEGADGDGDAGSGPDDPASDASEPDVTAAAPVTDEGAAADPSAGGSGEGESADEVAPSDVVTPEPAPAAMSADEAESASAPAVEAVEEPAAAAPAEPPLEAPPTEPAPALEATEEARSPKRKGRGKKAKAAPMTAAEANTEVEATLSDLAASAETSLEGETGAPDEALAEVAAAAAPAEAPLPAEAPAPAEAVAEAEPEFDEGEASADGLTDERLVSVVESLLFASDKPLSVNDLKRLLAMRDAKRITAAVEALTDRQFGAGVQVITVAGGWRLRTNPENGPWVSKLLVGKPVRLSRAMLETLAIIAYRQPITRPEVDEIRGVDCGPVLKTLLDRNLIRIIGKREEVGRPLLYGTTGDFLRVFNLKDLTELPTLREFHELTAESQAKVEAKHGGAKPAADPGAEPGPLAPPPGTVKIQPHAGIAGPDPDEDETLLEELDRATQAAARAAGGSETPTTPPRSEPSN